MFNIIYGTIWYIEFQNLSLNLARPEKGNVSFNLRMNIMFTVSVNVLKGAAG